MCVGGLEGYENLCGKQCRILHILSEKDHKF